MSAPEVDHVARLVLIVRSSPWFMRMLEAVATSVGVYLDERGQSVVIAPHGLADLFEVVVRRNPTRASLETYHRRVEQKRCSERWPRAQVVL